MKRWRWRDSMEVRNEDAASLEVNVRSMSASWMSMRSLFVRNAFPFTPLSVILVLLPCPSTAVNCPTADMC
jgi:hypothetical protein